ncbi:hypothetical protein GQ54DRAFT_300291 [Martensiomyces pterosporus]|nr:hypothetical protein GQ54DRAFT_300291 [Martensiomyces pterosporus]
MDQENLSGTSQERGVSSTSSGNLPRQSATQAFETNQSITADDTPPCSSSSSYESSATEKAPPKGPSGCSAKPLGSPATGAPETSFGEPLTVNMSRATSRFQQIQRTLSKPHDISTEESAVGMGGFDLTSWLTGRKTESGPPFSKRVGLVFDELRVHGDNVANRHISTIATPFYKITKSIFRGFGLRALIDQRKNTKLILHEMSGVVADGEIIRYFEQNGAEKCTPTANPAEYILDVVGNQASGISWPRVWSESKEKAVVLAEIDRINRVEHEHGNDQGNEEDSHHYARSIGYQTRIVTKRMFRTFWRDTQYNITRVALQIVTALVIGFSFFNLSESATDLQNKVFAIFLCSVLSVLVINQVQPQYLRQRLVFSRETSSNQYGWGAFAFAIILTEWPFSFVSNTCFFLCFYWTAGLNTTSDRAGYFYISYIVLGLYSLTVGQAIASIAPNDIIAALLNPIITVPSTMFAGVSIPYAAMPKFWRSWLYWLVPYHYYIEGVITNDLHGSAVRCKPYEFYTFEPPVGMTCNKYAGGFVKAAIGYIDNPDDTSDCRYCQFKIGDDFYRTLDWSFDHRWRNVGVMLGYIIFNMAFTLLMVKVYKVNKR